MVVIIAFAAGPPIAQSRGPKISSEEAIVIVLQGETGGNDFRISDMGSDLDFAAFDPAVAYNRTENQYLVVWTGDDNTRSLVDQEYEIFGQRINAASGAEVGNDFRISDMGPDGDSNYNSSGPAVAYNSADNEYLVVWNGDDDTGALVNNESKILGHRKVSLL